MGSIAGLHLTIDKTQCVVIFNESREVISAELRRIDSSISADLVLDYVKCLGIYVGPGAYDVAWRRAIFAFKEAVRFVRGIDAGFVPSITLYNILCVSLFAWIGSFLPPSRRVLSEEGKALQRISRGPWNVSPESLCTTFGVSASLSSATPWASLPWPLAPGMP